MPVRRLNLRARIAIAFAAVCIAVVAALGLMLFMAAEDSEHALVDAIVAEELDALIERSGGEAADAASGGPSLQYYVVRTAADRERLPPLLRELAPGNHEVGTGIEERHVAVRDHEGVRYVVAYDVGPHEMREARLQQMVLIALGGVAVLAIVLGYGLARVLTRQLTQLAGEVSRLSPDTPHAKLVRADHDAEVAALARALDDYHARILDLMRREQEFTANASHELRTPLTGIRTSCELLAAEAALDPKARARLGMIDGAARQMTERIDALLFLARHRRPEKSEKVALRRCVEEAAHAYADEIARKGLALEVGIAGDVVLETDRKALQLVLANLIRNAVRYTETGGIRVTYEAPRLTVSDTGVGIAPEHLPQLFQRHYRAAEGPGGFGLGLSIVRRICDDLRWNVQVESTPGAGSRFSVVFPS